MHNANKLVAQLQLIAHPEGGFFRETYRSGAAPMQSRGATDATGAVFETPAGERRNLLTSIYWMPTKASPIGWLCHNASAHVHYYHAGDALTYYIVSPAGELETVRLGPDLAAGEVMQLVVPGGHWKAAHLERGEYCLLGEAVSPGFDFNDFSFVSAEALAARCPDQANLTRFVRPSRASDFTAYYS